MTSAHFQLTTFDMTFHPLNKLNGLTMNQQENDVYSRRGDDKYSVELP